MKQLRNITALALAFFVWLGTTGYTLETPPLCCEGGEKACCPLEDDGTTADCCVIEIDYVQTGGLAVFFALPDIEFEGVSLLPPAPATHFTEGQTFALPDFVVFHPLPPPKVPIRTGRRVLQQVQCWRL